MSARPQLLSIAERHWRRIAVVLFLLGSLGVVLTRQVRHKPLPLTPPARLSQLSDNIHQQHPEWHLTPLEAGMEEGFFVSVRPLPRLEAEALRRQTTNRREWQGVVLCEPLKTETIKVTSPDVIYNNWLFAGDMAIINAIMNELP